MEDHHSGEGGGKGGGGGVVRVDLALSGEHQVWVPHTVHHDEPGGRTLLVRLVESVVSLILTAWPIQLCS